MCAVVLTGILGGVHTHPLASYFLVRYSTVIHLLTGEYRCLMLLDHFEDIYICGPLCPLVLIINPETIYIPLPGAVLSLTPPAVPNV